HGLLKSLPITSSVIYLLFGIAIGDHGFGIIQIHYLEDAKIIEVIAEITVIISLFTVGLKLRLPLKDGRWLVPISLATVSMLITIFFLTILSHYLLGFSWGEGILLGAILAPTDPVLASDVQVQHPGDHDPLKFALTSEGGINDGTAFPFVMLGLGLLGAEGKQWNFFNWLTVDLLWAVVCGFAVGMTAGLVISRLANFVRDIKKSYYLEDFLTISSIAISYGVAIQLKGYGFLAVFANALTIRQIELKETGVVKRIFKRELPDDVLSFNEQLERIFEVVSVVTIGLLIDFHSFKWSYLLFALVLFFVIRPLATMTGMMKSSMTLKHKGLISFFGIRGIGSLYYLYYALNHGLKTDHSIVFIQLTLWTILLSIFCHGIAVKPILKATKTHN
ncbi:MAG: sodium:proton antiporter, partial [Bdellovibrionales bacterium]|nr:sodium:proton antiporter [Bdellovibrionales bacterium]